MLKEGRHILAILVLISLSFSICVNGMHFVLVHGAGHGAWCWYKVATLLKSCGHNVTTMDLAASSINPKQVQEIHSISEYYEPLMTFMNSLRPKEKVILVGHSFGGVSISVVMEKFPHKIAVAVFVTAFVIGENLNLTALNQEMRKRTGSYVDTQIIFIDGSNKPPTAFLFGPKLMASKLYQLSPSQDLTLALSLLRPHFFFSDDKTLLKETKVTKQRNGRVPKVFIISKRDKLITEDAQLWIIERTAPYDDVKVIKDSDHMVMISQPKKLTSHILEISYKYQA